MFHPRELHARLQQTADAVRAAIEKHPPIHPSEHDTSELPTIAHAVTHDHPPELHLYRRDERDA